MGQLGLGVMIEMLAGNSESVAIYNGGIGKIIKSAELKDDRLYLHFEDGTAILFIDDGQSCCEHRYMVCDDDLSSLIGGTFIRAKLKDAPTIKEGKYDDEHEVQFLEIETSKGSVIVKNHNEHNGYYGGFCIRVHKV